FVASTVLGKVGPIIRGWKYGVSSGMPAYSKAYFSRNHYGQPRDMLEQRPFTRYFKVGVRGLDAQEGVMAGPVKVRFVDSDLTPTAPENTQSSNLDAFATSSVPFFDGEARNRPVVNPGALNASILSLSAFDNQNLELDLS